MQCSNVENQPRCCNALDYDDIVDALNRGGDEVADAVDS
jgi:hypothetical protein